MYDDQPRRLPEGMETLAGLAADLRWTWSHEADDLWRRIDPGIWADTKNPWVLLQQVTDERLARVGNDLDFLRHLREIDEAQRTYAAEATWGPDTHPEMASLRIAYFSMEYGLGSALPLYAGGLGVLAGDHLKAASDLGVPLTAVGLLYQEGYFHQVIDAAGRQREVYPYNDPSSLPVRPARSESGRWLRVPLALPGRKVQLRVWQADVGKVKLYLLDSNDPINTPIDRGITAKLYNGGSEIRLLQEMVLGIGGWRLLDLLDRRPDVCHLNEGHAAFLVLERARCLIEEAGLSFAEALWATRPGNVFTTHTSVGAAFDRFDARLIETYFPSHGGLIGSLGISTAQLLALGRRNPADADEPFYPAWLAMRGCGFVNGVSRLHGAVSRMLFGGLFPRWPEAEVPVDHITNGVHVPSWDSKWADRIWTEACGKQRWRRETETLAEAIVPLSDATIWEFCVREREDLVAYARGRLARHLGARGEPPECVEAARGVLDPGWLALGFARRFTAYKRPGLLLTDPDRLARILADRARPAQIVVAGMAHPDDEEGKRLIEAWVRFAQRPELRRHVVFLEDYDIAMAEELIRGVDVWINTPRRPWEACGTSGMKALANGGLNLSTLDGWWAEAYAPEFGWAVDGTPADTEAETDDRDAERLYRLLEDEVVPEFYDRDDDGVPRHWVARIRASMAVLAPRYSSNRMVREYVEKAYLPAARRHSARLRANAALAKELAAWADRVAAGWTGIRFGACAAQRDGENWMISVPLALGELAPRDVRVELYAEPADGRPAVCAPMAPAPAGNTGIFSVRVPADRLAEHFTPRVVPRHPGAALPAELPLIAWQR